MFTISQNISASTGAKGEVKSSFYYSLILFTNILVIKTNLLSFLIPITWMFFSIFFIKERGSRTSRPSKIKLYILIIYFSSVLPANNWVINLYTTNWMYFFHFFPSSVEKLEIWESLDRSVMFVKNINNSNNFWPFFPIIFMKNEQPALQNVHLTAL